MDGLAPSEAVALVAAAPGPHWPMSRITRVS